MFTDGHPAEHLDGTTDPLGIFSAFMSDERLQDLVQHTNSKMIVLRQSIGERNRETFTYSDVDLPELKALIASLIVAGIRNDNHLNTTIMFRTDFGVPFYW